MLRWDTSHAVEVFLEDEPVDANGSRQVCPAAPQVYRLRVVGEEQEDTYELTLGVNGSSTAASAAPSSTPSPTSTPLADAPSPTSAASPSSTDTALAAEAITPSPPGEHLTADAASENEGAANTSPTTVEEHNTATESTATPVSVADLFPAFTPTPTPASVAEAPSAAPISDASAPSMAEDDLASPFTLIGYVAFSLIAGGLLGWLALTTFGRK